MILSRDVFCALAAIVWADGVVTDDEADALLHAASACGLRDEAFASVQAAIGQPTDLSMVRELTLSHDERLFVYGVAAWLTRVDGVVSWEETAALAKLGSMLELPEHDRTVAAAASLFAFESPASGLPHDVRRLADEIARVAFEP